MQNSCLNAKIMIVRKQEKMKKMKPFFRRDGVSPSVSGEIQSDLRLHQDSRLSLSLKISASLSMHDTH